VLVLGCSFYSTKASFTYTDLFRCLASVRFTRSSTEWNSVHTRFSARLGQHGMHVHPIHI